MDTLKETVQTVQDKLGAAILDFQQQDTQNFRHPTYLARLAAPQLLVLQNPVFRQFLLSSSLVSMSCCLQYSLAHFLRSTRSSSYLSEDPLVSVLESASRQDTDHLSLFLALGLAYVSTDPDIQEASALFNLFLSFRAVGTVSRLSGDKGMETLVGVGGVAVLAVMGVKVIRTLIEL